MSLAGGTRLLKFHYHSFLLPSLSPFFSLAFIISHFFFLPLSLSFLFLCLSLFSLSLFSLSLSLFSVFHSLCPSVSLTLTHTHTHMSIQWLPFTSILTFLPG